MGTTSGRKALGFSVKALGFSVVLGVVLSMVVAACGGGADPTAVPTAPAPTAVPAATPAATAVPQATARPAPTAAPTPTATPAFSAKYGGSISWAWCCPNLPNLDPHYGNHMTAQSVSPIYNRLMKLDTLETANDVVVVPDIAEGVTLSGDGQSMTFQLRSGVLFHNGRELTSADVKWNLERLSSEGSSYKATYKNVVGFETPDPYTFVIKTSQVDVLLPFAMAGREAYMAAPETEDLKTQAIGTGPFTLNRSEKDVGVFMDRNDSYWKEDQSGNQLPYVNATESLIIPDRAARTAATVTGKLTYIEYLFNEEVIEVKRAIADIQVFEYLWQSSYVLYYNQNNPMFQDVRVRKALALGMNLDAHIQASFGGLGQWAGPVSGQHGSAWALTPEELAAEKYSYRYDVEEAKALLKAAGIPEGYELHVDSVKFQRDYEANVEVFIEEMKALGFKVVSNVEPDFASFKAHTEAVGFKDVAWGFGGANSPESYLNNNYHSTGVKNSSGLADPKLDAFIDDLLATSDVAERQVKVKAVQDYILSNQLVLQRVADSLTWAVAHADLRTGDSGRYKVQPINTYVRDHERLWFDS